MTTHKPWCNTGCDAENDEHNVLDGDTLLHPCDPPPCPPEQTIDLGAPALVASGGWCAPTETLYDLSDPGVAPGPELYGPVPGVLSVPVDVAARIELPTFTVPRGGVSYKPMSPAEQAARDAFERFVRRAAERAIARRDTAIEVAAFTAYLGGWDLHVYNPPQPFDLYRAGDRDLQAINFVGIEFRERTTGRSFPTIHEHPTDPNWADWIEDDD